MQQKKKKNYRNDKLQNYSDKMNVTLQLIIFDTDKPSDQRCKKNLSVENRTS